MNTLHQKSKRNLRNNRMAVLIILDMDFGLKGNSTEFLLESKHHRQSFCQI